MALLNDTTLLKAKALYNSLVSAVLFALVQFRVYKQGKKGTPYFCKSYFPPSLQLIVQ